MAAEGRHRELADYLMSKAPRDKATSATTCADQKILNLALAIL
jgi:hypothetical protein